MTPVPAPSPLQSRPVWGQRLPWADTSLPLPFTFTRARPPSATRPHAAFGGLSAGSSGPRSGRGRTPPRGAPRPSHGTHGLSRHLGGRPALAGGPSPAFLLRGTKHLFPETTAPPGPLKAQRFVPRALLRGKLMRLQPKGSVICDRHGESARSRPSVSWLESQPVPLRAEATRARLANGPAVTLPITAFVSALLGALLPQQTREPRPSYRPSPCRLRSATPTSSGPGFPSTEPRGLRSPRQTVTRLHPESTLGRTRKLSPEVVPHFLPFYFFFPLFFQPKS